MDLQQLHYFLAVAKDGNVTKTAEKLHIAQPALSQSLKRLSSDLGAPLFIKKGRNIELSQAGKAVMKKVTPLLEEIDRLPLIAQDAYGEERKTVKVNVLSASNFITYIIIAFKNKYPDVNFFVTQSPTEENWDIQVSSGFSHKLKRNEIQAFEEEILLAIPKSWPQSKELVVNLSDFKNVPFIAFTGVKPFQNLCESFCRFAGVQPKVSVQSDNPMAVRDLIGSGFGVAFWPSISWSPLRSENVKFAEIANPVCRRKVLVSTNGNLKESSPQMVFYNFMIDYIFNQMSEYDPRT